MSAIDRSSRQVPDLRVLNTYEPIFACYRDLLLLAEQGLSAEVMVSGLEYRAAVRPRVGEPHHISSKWLSPLRQGA